MKQYCDCVALGAYNCVLHNYQWEIFHATLEGNIISYFEIGCRKKLDSYTTHEAKFKDVFCTNYSASQTSKL